MSPDEKREQKIRLRVDLEEAEEELSHCREAANAKGDLLAQLATWLKVSPELYIYRASGSVHEGFDVKPIPEKYVTVLDIKPLLTLGDDIRRAQRRVLDLRERLSRL